MARPVIQYVRLALLTPEELKQVEADNDKDKLIPVSFLYFLLDLNNDLNYDESC